MSRNITLEARVLLEEHRTGHNEIRPHSSLGYKTPSVFFESWLASKKERIVEPIHNPGLS